MECLRLNPSKATSSRTRIETKIESLPAPWLVHLLKQHPAEQGLKLRDFGKQVKDGNSSKATSSRTRIETHILYLPDVGNRLLKQHPAEQGLKQAGIGVANQRFVPSKATSSRTRIETLNSPFYHFPPLGF